MGYLRGWSSLIPVVVASALLSAAPFDGAHARSVASIAAGAAAKRITNPASASAARSAVRATNPAVRTSAGGKPKDVVVRRGEYPESAAHIEAAQRRGQPTVLTLDRANKRQRRAGSLEHIKRKDSSPAGKDRDEYPPAMTREGGFNSDVRYIDAGDNRGAGAIMGHQVRDLPDGARVRILVAE